MFKLALDPGHGYYTSGKRCLKSLDRNETREWWLNDRIVDSIVALLSEYEGIEVKRVDDPTGKTDVTLSKRVGDANKWNADLYLSIHHNAGINGGSGGGIVAYMHPNAGAATESWRDELYTSIVKATGLKGNRATPCAKANHYVTRMTKMPAVLLELGFMDSKTDVPIILTEAYAYDCAEAIVDTIVRRRGLTKKVPAGTYKVQVGAFSNQPNAEKLKAELIAKGYPATIVYVK
jgi:N-acetylmuramoyl-L-alanine amidase